MQIPEIVIDKLINAEKVVILTGAGVSAESGIKTFRDPDGLWSKMNPAELASPQGFMKNPELVWDWYQHRRDIINSVKPNAGHYAIAEMEKMFKNFALFTQNVDRLHQTAGSSRVYELHGNIIDNHCFRCEAPFTGEVNLPDKQLPKCPECGGQIRPSVVWFGENLPEDVLDAADYYAKEAEVFFTIGTSAEVYPAANIPLLAKDYGAFVIEVNPNKTSITNYLDCHLGVVSGEAMPEIVRLIKERRNK